MSALNLHLSFAYGHTLSMKSQSCTVVFALLDQFFPFHPFHFTDWPSRFSFVCLCVMQDACFAYLNLGPDHFNGPVSLLAGLSRSQALLLRHFVAVAWFGVWRTVKGDASSPSSSTSSTSSSSSFVQVPALPFRLLTAVRMIRQAVSIISPLVESERTSWTLLAACRVLRVALWC